MTPTPYDIVREACVQANPEIEQMDCGSPCHCNIPNYRDIRLADVLMAMPKFDTKGNPIKYEASANCLYQLGKGGVYEFGWHLAHDSLEWHRDNKPETVAWLAKLLTSN